MSPSRSQSDRSHVKVPSRTTITLAAVIAACVLSLGIRALDASPSSTRRTPKESGRASAVVNPGANVTPDGNSVILNGYSSSQAWFTVQNPGTSSGTYSIAITCTGIVSNCVPSTTSVTINASAQTTVYVNYNTTAYASSGVLRLKATLNSNPAVKDSGHFNVTTTATPVISVTPDGGTQVVDPDTYPTSTGLVIGNTGSSVQVTITPICTGAAVVGATCFTQPSPIWLSGQMGIPVIWTSSATLGATGRVMVLVKAVTDTMLRDSGWVDVVTKSHSVSVTPDAGSASPEPNTASSSTFTLTNTGNVNGTYGIIRTCSGEAIPNGWSGCSQSATQVWLAAGTSTNVSVNYTSGARGTTGKIKLWVVSDVYETQSDTGWVNVAVPAHPAVSVGPDAQTINVGANQDLTQSIVINNTGDATDTYYLQPLCTGEGFSVGCSLSADSVVVPSGGQYGVTLSYRTGEPATNGRLVVLATSRLDPAVKDSAWVNFNVLSGGSTISVTPDGAIQSGFTANSTNRSVTFTLNGSGTYWLTATCTGAAITGGCTPQANPVAIGQNYPLTVFFNSGASGSTGRVTLSAKNNNDPTIVDIGAIDVKIGTPTGSVVAVAPDGFAETQIAPGTLQTVSFTISNPGNASLTMNLAATCTGLAVSAGCTLGQGSVSLAPNAFAAVPVSYTSGSASATGRIRLVATSTTGTTPTDSGWIDLSVLPAAPVVVTPKGENVTALADQSNQVTFRLHNPGALTRTYNMKVVCSGQIFTTACSAISQSQVTINPGTGLDWGVSYTAGSSGKTGSVKVVATLAENAALRDSGFVNLTATTTVLAKASVSPDGVSAFIYPGTSGATQFQVFNSGTAPGTFSLAASCSGAAIVTSCSPSPSSVSLNPGTMSLVNVNYTAGSVGTTGLVKLTATLTTNSAIKDSGSVNVSTGATGPTTVAVDPDGDYWSLAPNTGWSRQFTIRNTGPAAATFNLTPTCTGAAISSGCTLSASSVAIPPLSSKTVSMTVLSGQSTGLTGTMKVVAVQSTDAAVKDSGWYNVITNDPKPFVTPDGQNIARAPGVSGSVTFDVRNPTSLPQQYALAVRCNDPAFVGGCGLSATSITVNSGVSVSVSATFTTSSAGTTGKVVLTASPFSGPANVDSGWVNVTVQVPALASITVQPKGDVENGLTPNLPTSLAFVVRNPGSGTGTYTLTTACSWAGQPLTCTAVPATLNLSAGQTSDSVRVNFTPGNSATSGIIKLHASLDGYSTTVKDSGWVTASTGAGGSPAVNVSTRTVNPGVTIARNQCLTIAAGDDAAVECGDLRLVQALPTTTTMGKARTPTLIYNSQHQKPFAIIAANVSLAPGITPTTLEATVAIPGKSNTTKTFNWDSSVPAGQVRRIAVMIDAVQLAMGTGTYTYTLEVKAKNGSTVLGTPGTDTGTVVIIDRSQSPFGAGWWLDGLEQLLTVNSTQKLWIGGDGSTRIYSRVGSTDTWLVADMVDRPDTLLAVTVGGQQYFRRKLRNRAYVEFDNTGRHVATMNAQQHKTTFVHSTVLTKLRLPAPDTTKGEYTFHYALDGSGQPQVLDSVRAPSNSGEMRTVQLERTGTWRITKIKDPKKSPDPDRWIGFKYDATSYRLTGRRNRRDDSTFFAYRSNSGHIMTVTVDMVADPDIVTNFCAAEDASLVVCSLDPQPLDAVKTLVSGPRTVDSTWFYVNRFGAPDTIVNALGQKTRIRRGDPRFPFLATSVIQPNGFETQAAYTDRGLPDFTTAIAPLAPGDTRNAITTYTWNPVLDLVDMVTGPTGEKTIFGYDPMGNRTSQEDGRGVTSRVIFSYDVLNRVQTIRQPGASGVDSIGHDPLMGNVELVKSAMGSNTRYVTDAIGRNSTIKSPIDLAGLKVTVDSFKYDLMDRLTEQWTKAPDLPFDFQGVQVVGGMPAMVLHVTNAYDANGQLTAVLRQSKSPQGALLFNGLGQPQTTYTYDAAGRKTSETNPFRVQQWSYDLAGNITRDSSALGIVTMTYDALNRVKTRIVPRRAQNGGIINVAVNPQPQDYVNYPYFKRPISGGGVNDSLIVFRDSAFFDYDETGNLLRADNNDARVRRGYFPNGQLKVDTLHHAYYNFVAAATTPSFPGTPFTQVFVYDLSGRRVSRTDNGNTVCAGCYQSYGYNPQSGLLEWTEDQGQTVGSRVRFNFSYDGVGRLINRSTTGTTGSQRVSVGFAYDDDGQLVSRTTTSVPSNNVPKLIYQDNLTYDGRGKVVDASISSDLTEISLDSWQFKFNGLGALGASGRTRGSGAQVDVMELDALGSVRSKIQDYTSPNQRTLDFDVGGDQVNNIVRRPHLIVSDGGVEDSTVFASAYSFDGNGNQTQENTLVSKALSYTSGVMPSFNTLTTGGHSWQWMMHGVDNKLRYVQKTWYTATAQRRTVFTEYRYDALGRRVLARTRQDSTCTLPPNPEHKCVATMERFVWDGDQLLAEYRGQGGYEISETNLNGIGGGSGNFHGNVRYTHASGIDEPLIVWGGGSGLEGLIPHLSWRGKFEAGSDLGGNLLEGGTSPVWIWTERYRDLNLANEVQYTPPDPTRWLGSLIEGQLEVNGVAYRRNRYYSPTTGRFTSSDPIGLAGGLNLYGFAEGDPVNFADPFGLFPCGPATPLCARVAVAVLAKLPTIIRVVSELATDLDGGEGSAIANFSRPGKRGGLDHRARLAQVGDAIEGAGLRVLAGGKLPERAVQVGGGRVRYPDLIAQASDGSQVFVNIGKARQDGQPIAREARALEDLSRTGITTLFVPYNRK